MNAERRIRPATDDDVAVITGIYRSDLPQGKWWSFGGRRRRPASIEELSPFEQWLNGGAWMNEDYLRVHLKRAADLGHLALVIEERGSRPAGGSGWIVRGEIEVYFYREARPAGAPSGGRPEAGSLVAHIGVLQVERGFFRRGFGGALVRRACLEALRRGAYRVTVVSSRDNLPFYRHCGFSQLTPVVTVEGRLSPKAAKGGDGVNGLNGQGRPTLIPPPPAIFAEATWPIIAGIHPGPGQAWFLYSGQPYPDPEFLAHRLDLSMVDLPEPGGRLPRPSVVSFRQNQIDDGEVIFYCLAAPRSEGADPSFGGVERAAFGELVRWARALGYQRYRTYLTGPDYARLRFAFRMREAGREFVSQLRTADLTPGAEE
ncbi:MAG TPA: GNAT family N-acetyltransferase [Bacillota bacterium]|jgi:GNAT superfamily N-acetyltransferase